MTTENNDGSRGNWQVCGETWNVTLTHFKVLLKTELLCSALLVTQGREKEHSLSQVTHRLMRKIEMHSESKSG